MNISDTHHQTTMGRMSWLYINDGDRNENRLYILNKHITSVLKYIYEVLWSFEMEVHYQ